VGSLGEAPLPGTPGVPGLDLPQRQQALGGDALVGHDAEELAGGQAGIFHEQLEIVARGKILAQLPRANSGNRDAQILGNLLERNLALPPPVGEGGRKAGADIAVELSLLGHGESLRPVHTSMKGRNPGNGGEAMDRPAQSLTETGLPEVGPASKPIDGTCG